MRPHVEWNEEELGQLQALRGLASSREISSRLGRSRNAVKLKMSRMSLCIDRAPKWTDAEIERLRVLALTMTCLQASREIGRGRTTVYWKASQLGIVFAKKQPKVKVRKQPLRFWTESELNQLRELAASLSVTELARQIGRSVAAVSHMTQRLKLRVGYARPSQKIAPGERIERPRPAAGRKIEPSMITVPRVVYCEVCSAPVVGTFSGWASHYERVGCNRKAKRA